MDKVAHGPRVEQTASRITITVDAFLLREVNAEKRQVSIHRRKKIATEFIEA